MEDDLDAEAPCGRDGWRQWLHASGVIAGVAVLAVSGGVIALVTMIALGVGDWDFRPQDRSESYWLAVVQLGTAGFITAGFVVTAAAVLGLASVPRYLRDQRLEALVGPFAIVLSSAAVVGFAACIGALAIERAGHSGLL